MDPARWQRTQRLFEEALEHRPDAQHAFVKRAAGDDADLARQVLALLEADAQATFLDADVGVIARDVLDDPPKAAVNAGMQVGPYRLKDALGEGGSGVVYVATRDDIGHEVAIKILRDAWVSEQRRGRFEREPRTLAKLNHPAIARIFDAGVLEGGTPWFAMELVDGVRLDEFCRARAIDRTGVVRLVREIAAAVQHAHERLIVHRDLKPNNILVTADGQPKLLDFGIARQIAVSPAEREHTVALRVLTPGYASPEELRGEPPGVQSDVYSLGVILRSLLAAAPNAAAARADWLGARAHSRDRTARHDLDLICRTATHDDQALRYATADALVRDLDAWLTGRPLAARPASSAYRMRRFVSRNRRRIAAAVLVVATVAGVVGASARRIAVARAATDAEAARSDRLLRFLLDLFEGGDQGGSPSADLRVVALLDRGVREAELLGADPHAQGDLFGTLGQVYRELGELDRADSLLTRALAIRQERRQEQPAEVVHALVALSALRRAQARYDDAEALAIEALDLTRTIANDDAPLRLEARTAVGRVQGDKGQYAVAAATLEDVIQRYGDDPARAADRAVAVMALADAYFYLGDMDRAERESSRALDLHRQNRGVRHPSVGQALINLGAIASVRGDLVAAERYFRDAAEIMQAWFGEGHPETASAMTSLGQTVRSLNRLAESRDLFDRARAIQERVFGPLHPKTAFVYNELGILAFMAEDYPAAEAAFGRAVAAYAATHHPQEPLSVANLGSVHLRRGDYPQAEREFVRALGLYKGVVPDDHLNVAIARVKLGRAILRQHRPEEARPLLEMAERILAAQPGPESTWLKSAREDLAQLRGDAAPVAAKP